MKRRVFCIGFQKTGTTTMGDALSILGFRVVGFKGCKDPDIAQNLEKMVARIAPKYDAYQDNPWPLVYRQMDAMFPGSRFILTVRDPDSWYSSIVRHFGTDETPMRQYIYGVASPVGNAEIYKERMLRHNAEVLEYFKDRPDDLLVLDLSKSGNWPTICGFLGEPIPSVPFPHSNTPEHRKIRRKYRQFGWPGRLAARVAFAMGMH